MTSPGLSDSILASWESNDPGALYVSLYWLLRSPSECDAEFLTIPVFTTIESPSWFNALMRH